METTTGRANRIVISSTSPFSEVQTKSINTQNNLGQQATGRTSCSLIPLQKKHGNLLWDGTNDNPIIEVSMKVKGDQQGGILPVTVQRNDAAAFGIKLAEEGRLELPIDESSWEEAFQAGEDGMMDSEDTPGFTLVVASAAIGMAMFINASKDEELEE